MRTGQVPATELREFGRRLIRLRLAKHWSAEDVGRRIGCSGRAVLQWEEGDRVPGADWLAALADLYGIPMDQLWHGER